MQGPDYTHWHGTCDLAKHFYTKTVPEREDLIPKGRASGDPRKVKAADALQARLDEVLNSRDHQWYLGKMDPKEKAKRNTAAGSCCQVKDCT